MRRLFLAFSAWRTNPHRLRITSRDRILFAKRLSLYLRAGIPISESLDLIREMPGSRGHARLLKTVAYDIRDGIQLSRALRSFPRAYAPLSIQLIAVGEASGTLPHSLAQLGAALEARAARIRSILGMLAYPLILLIGSLGVTIFLIAYVFPKIVPLFRGLHAQLPFTTRVLLALSGLFQRHGIILVGGMTTVVCLLVFTIRSPKVRVWIDPLLTRIPTIGPLVRTLSLALIFRTLSTLLGSGIRLDQAVQLVEEGMPNYAYKVALSDIRQFVLAGGKLSSALRLSPSLFPTVSLQFMMVGEMTGTLAESTASAAILFEEESAERIRLFASLLEPILMLVMGIVIGFVALGIISPMYGITQNLSA